MIAKGEDKYVLFNVWKLIKHSIWNYEREGIIKWDTDLP